MVSDPGPPKKQNFYPRPPWGGRPDANGLTQCSLYISIHALRGEGDATL